MKATPLLTLALRAERDVVAARQRSLQIARLLGFDAQDQVRIATAVSEIARNVVNYAGQGEIAFAVARRATSPRPWTSRCATRDRGSPTWPASSPAATSRRRASGWGSSARGGSWTRSRSSPARAGPA